MLWYKNNDIWNQLLYWCESINIRESQSGNQSYIHIDCLQKVCIFYTLLKRIFTLIYRFFLNVINVFVIYFHILINRQARFLLKSLKPIDRRITVWYREEWRKQLILKLPHIYISIWTQKPPCNISVCSLFVLFANNFIFFLVHFYLSQSRTKHIWNTQV